MFLEKSDWRKGPSTKPRSTRAAWWPEPSALAVAGADGVRGEVVLGVSAGDDADPDPYAYVALSELGRGLVATDDWWNRPWGRWVPTGDIATTDDLVAFYEDGLRHVRRGAGGPG